MNKIVFLILLIPLFIACESMDKPIIYDTDLLIFSNGEVEVDYRIGQYVYYLKISNLSDKEILIDPSRLTIVSTEREAKNLGAKSSSLSIPPDSFVIYECDQETFYKTDIDSPFSIKRVRSKAFQTSRSSLESHLGSVIRIFIPYIIDGEEKSADIKLPLPFLKDQTL